MRLLPVTAAAVSLAIALAVPGAHAQTPVQPHPHENADPSAPSAQNQPGANNTQNQPGSASTNANGGGAGGTLANSTMQGPQGTQSADKKFVQKAMEGSQAEIKLGQLAQEKASSPDVKQFGQKMVDDHTQLSQQMQPVASQLGVSAPTDLSAKDKALEAKLSALSGNAFDKAYMDAMVKDHKKDLAEFKHEAKDAKTPEVKNAAEQGVQVIQQHLELAEQVAQKVGASAGNNKSASSSTPGSMQ